MVVETLLAFLLNVTSSIVANCAGIAILNMMSRTRVRKDLSERIGQLLGELKANDLGESQRALLAQQFQRTFPEDKPLSKEQLLGHLNDLDTLFFRVAEVVVRRIATEYYESVPEWRAGIAIDMVSGIDSLRCRAEQDGSKRSDAESHAATQFSSIGKKLDEIMVRLPDPTYAKRNPECHQSCSSQSFLGTSSGALELPALSTSRRPTKVECTIVELESIRNGEIISAIRRLAELQGGTPYQFSPEGSEKQRERLL